MHPYRQHDFVVPAPYRPRRPLWLTMVVSTALVVVSIAGIVAAQAALIGAMS